ncbi:protein of unknown function DUF846 [Metschnikowia aff. pulcherrima]|uniref:Golgi apparatus membrane protein TVP23 n=2 Tax=Metschnikowia TaxID=27320 RepID=A0A4P6XHW0_9ASCO|nr:protein of unknown function DUF846 [Metschnikowia aff. pulcherrima]
MSAYTQIDSDELETPSFPGPEPRIIPPSSTTGATSHPRNERSLIQRLKESSHPIALLCFIFFRTAPIFVYLFGNLFLALITKESRFILHFIMLILLISADFWNLKNISGRLLVGLRWWNETSTQEGLSESENVWVFETADPERYINPIDSKVFWTLLYVQPMAWAVLGVMAILKLELLYLILIVISISLSLTNAIAFTKCDKFGKANLVANDLFSRATNGFFAKLNPFA